MDVTEVRIKLMEDSDDRLQAFCSITFDDCFVVRDLKIIEGSNGPFVAMPSRKLTSHCHVCGCKNHLRAQFCNQCGKRISHRESDFEDDGRAKLYADIAHPINTDCREMIQQLVIDEYEREIELADEPGYSHRYDEDYAAARRERLEDDDIDRDEPAAEDPQDADDPEPRDEAPERVERDSASPQDDAEQSKVAAEVEAAASQDEESEGFGDGIL